MRIFSAALVAMMVPALALAQAPTQPQQRLQLNPAITRLELNPTPAGGIRAKYSSFEAADALADASVKYSWSGPLKWTVLSAGLFSLVNLGVGSGETEDRLKVSGTAAAVGAILLIPTLLLDASARRDVMRASGISAEEREAIYAARARAARAARASDTQRDASADAAYRMRVRQAQE